MTQIDKAWGAGPSENFEALAAIFRPIFDRIREGAVQRELNRILPFEQIGWLKDARFGALRVPKEHGGHGATLPELFGLFIELSQADSNITQALRGHFGFVENILLLKDENLQKRWYERLVAGQLTGNAWSETGESKQAKFSTILKKVGDEWRLTGTKYYTTGSLFADWIDVGAFRENDEKSVVVVVDRHAEGVNVIDDWDGVGQRLTASGTSTFDNVLVDEINIKNEDDYIKYGQAYFQLVHIATLAGIGRAAATELAEAVAKRDRHYSFGAGPRASQDPQILQVVGRVHANAYAAGVLALKVAEGLQRIFDLRDSTDADAVLAQASLVDLEAAQAQTVVTNLILEATTILYDSLGASALKAPTALDRFWRNARTLSSHNPRVYKDRIVGDFAVNGTPHPTQWRIGKVE